MDGYQFTAALVASVVSLAWPIAAVVLGLIFRKPILALLDRITRVKAAGVELSVAERSAEAVEELPPAVGNLPVLPMFEMVDDPAIDDMTEEAQADVLTSVTRITVDAIILRAWAKLEAALERESPGPKSAGQSAMTSAEQLLRAGKAPSSVVASVDQLRRIRNDVAHARTSVTMIDAMTFDNAVESVINVVRIANGEKRLRTDQDTGY